MLPDGPLPLVFERFGTLYLPRGGKHGYKGVRGEQGTTRDKFQGHTPRKTHVTKLYTTAHEAAVNLALLKRELEENSEEEEEKKARKARKDKKVARHARPRCTCDMHTDTCVLEHLSSEHLSGAQAAGPLGARSDVPADAAKGHAAEAGAARHGDARAVPVRARPAHADRGICDAAGEHAPHEIGEPVG